MPKISVIIPAYNAMDYLPSTLDSVLNQTFNDFEILIVNDGSSDDIKTWFDNKVRDYRVKLFSQANKGISAARNTGIKNAKGAYFAFLDADDLWDLDKLKKQVQVLDKDPRVGLVYTWVAYIDGQGNPTGRIRKNYAEGMVWSTLIQHNIVECGSVALVRRECFEKVGLFDDSLHSVEDLDMWLRVAKYYSFQVIAEPLVYYRQHTSSLSRNWTLMEDRYLNLLDRAFASASSEFSSLKPRSYALALICVAWKPIQHQHRDYKESLRLLKKAVSYDRRIIFSRDFLHLYVAITAIRFLGNDVYLRLLSVLYKIRHRIFMAPKVKHSSD